MSIVTTTIEDHPRAPPEPPIFANMLRVGEGYFETMGIDLLEGRTFQPSDGAVGFRAVVVSESFARQWWPDMSPLGRRIGNVGNSDENWWQIVGVVSDVRHAGLESDPEQMVYYPSVFGQVQNPGTVRTMDIVVKTSGSPLQLVPVVRRELRDLHPRIPLSNPRSMEDVFDAAMAGTSFTMAMLGAASGIALLLGLVGIYGVISYVVSLRTTEIGVRMAMGATAPSVRGMVVRQGLVLAFVGVGMGLVGAGALSRFISSLLYGVSALDPLTYGVVAVALVSVAACASWIPARRAAAVDPSQALRDE
jgi:predicted permease